MSRTFKNPHNSRPRTCNFETHIYQTHVVPAELHGDHVPDGGAAGHLADENRRGFGVTDVAQKLSLHGELMDPVSNRP